MMDTSHSLHTLDVRKLLCPLPVIRLQQTIQKAPNHTVIEVLATDPGVLYDIPAWCRIHGHRILSVTQHQHPTEIRIQVEVNHPSPAPYGGTLSP